VLHHHHQQNDNDDDRGTGVCSKKVGVSDMAESVLAHQRQQHHIHHRPSSPTTKTQTKDEDAFVAASIHVYRQLVLLSLTRTP
jgi:hypothetical protein